MDEEKKVEIIPFDAIMNIDISGSFYQRLQAVFLYLASLKDEKEFLLHYTAITKIKADELTDDYEKSLYTIVAFIHEIELAARKTDKVKLVDKKDITNPSGN